MSDRSRGAARNARSVLRRLITVCGIAGSRLRSGVVGVMSLAALALLCACGSAATPTPIVIQSLAQPKVLATVYISPTPDESELQATRLAFRPSPTPPPATAPPTATVYIGVFMGESANLDDVAAIATLGALPTVERTRVSRFANCPLPPDERFGLLWREDAQATRDLGCPAAQATPYNGTTQIFERGVMYYNPDGAIWAVAPRAGGEGRYWFVQQAPAYESIDVPAPPGLRVPALGFGALWMGVPGVRDALGFAQTEERGVTFIVQLFQGGSLLYDQSAGHTFVLVGPDDSGTAHGPY